MIRMKRTYERSEKSDGFRILIDRLWPRGLTKDRAQIDLWLKDLSPSAELRKWFSHDPGKWDAFRERYRKELEEKKDMLREIKSIEKEKGTITLLYSARDTEHNDAVVLLEELTGKGPF